MADQFKPGDVVQVKSGGPKMTVDSIQSNGEAWCIWFPTFEMVKGAGFKPAALKHVTE